MGDEIFSIEALAAGKGDCLLIHSGSCAEPKLLVVDGGPTHVYRDALRKRLVEMAAGQDDGYLPVDLVIVSHLDDDHIGGILELVRQEVDELRGPKQLVDINCLWHNAFSDILEDTQTPFDLSPDGTAALGGGQSLAGLDQLDTDDRMVLASVAQGRCLRNAIAPLRDNGMKLNTPFGAQALVMADASPEDPITSFGGNLAICVIGPMQREVARLRNIWQKYLREKGLGRAEADNDVLAALRRDVSVTNLSSIVVLLHQGDRSILLTGDARDDRILEGLEAQKKLVPGNTMQVDVLKLPHHGSPANNSAEFLRRIQARHYIISGNGEHGNPARETIETLVSERDGEPIHLHFTHGVATIDKNRQKHAERYNKEWAHTVHSLKAWCKTRPDNVDVTFSSSFRGVSVDLRPETGPGDT